MLLQAKTPAAAQAASAAAVLLLLLLLLLLLSDKPPSRRSARGFGEAHCRSIHGAQHRDPGALTPAGRQRLECTVRVHLSD
jgi:hypothetical protein